MKIGIIGSGNMGRATGVRLSHAGHEVAFGSRLAAQAAEAASNVSDRAFAASLDEAVRAQFPERAPHGDGRTVRGWHDLGPSRYKIADYVARRSQNVYCGGVVFSPP